MQKVKHDAAFTSLLCCDISMEVLGAHWDIGQRWPGAVELEFLGVQVTGCCWRAVAGSVLRPGLWRAGGKLVCEGGPLARTTYVWLDILWAGSWAAVGGCMEGI